MIAYNKKLRKWIVSGNIFLVRDANEKLLPVAGEPKTLVVGGNAMIYTRPPTFAGAWQVTRLLIGEVVVMWWSMFWLRPIGSTAI